MKNALSAAGIAMLQECLTTDPVYAFDFDGTLAPIVTEPQAAALPLSTRAILNRLASERTCIVVSGRLRNDVLSRLSGIPLAQAIGNHGSEPWLDSGILRRYVLAALPTLKERLSHFKGVGIEDKGVSVSIHYRNVFHRAAVIATIRQVAQSLGFAHIIPGKLVLNLLPPGAFDKAQGLLRAMEELHRCSAIYIGDDVTDERVFSLPKRYNVLGIRVGYRRDSHAALYLSRQQDIDVMLSFLLEQGRTLR